MPNTSRNKDRHWGDQPPPYSDVEMGNLAQSVCPSSMISDSRAKYAVSDASSSQNDQAQRQRPRDPPQVVVSSRSRRSDCWGCCCGILFMVSLAAIAAGLLGWGLSGDYSAGSTDTVPTVVEVSPRVCRAWYHNSYYDYYC